MCSRKQVAQGKFPNLSYATRVAPGDEAMSERVLITGATGQLGAYLVREFVSRGLHVTAWGHSRPVTLFGVPRTRPPNF